MPSDSGRRRGPTPKDPFDKTLAQSSRIRNLRDATGRGRSPSMYNDRRINKHRDRGTPGWVPRHDAEDPGLIREDVWLYPGNHYSGQLLEFQYTGQDSQGRATHDPKPLIIYINTGHPRVCQGIWKYNKNAGDTFITGINIHYTDLEMGAALGRIIKEKGKHINMTEVKRINKWIPYAAFRMYYLKGISNALGVQGKVTKVITDNVDY